MSRKQHYNTKTPERSPIGILLANSGSPDEPTPAAVRIFLRKFLSDPRVINYPRWLWIPILNSIILSVRPRRSARLYQQIWSNHGSPLLDIVYKQAELLQSEMNAKLDTPIEILPGMRYSSPSIAHGLSTLRARGVARYLILPLFPQFSNTTTTSMMDAVYAETRNWNEPYQLRSVPHYNNHPAYIKALSNSVIRHWESHGRSERLLISFHGIPHSYIKAGDPYGEQCQKTSTLLAEALGIESNSWQIAYQSRFGPQKWLQPYTDQTLVKWGKEGIKSVDVICPGFSSDCLETLYEIQIEAKETFQSAGGTELNYIPALNAHPDHIQALSEIIHTHIIDWTELYNSGPEGSNFNNKSTARVRLGAVHQ